MVERSTKKNTPDEKKLRSLVMRTLIFRDTVFIQDTRPLSMPPRRGGFWFHLKRLFSGASSRQRKAS